MAEAETEARRYRAFISYSHADRSWGRWVHRAVETYRPPRSAGVGTRPIKPVFRDDDETASSSDLGAVITQALMNSDTLVVICSPNSAGSQWVDKEIRDFKALGKQGNIYPIIIDGRPHDSEQECFPPSLKLRAGPDGVLTDAPAEPLAIDVRAHGRRDTLLKLVAGLHGIPYDNLKRRDRKRRLWRVALSLIAVFVVLSAYAGTLFVQTRSVNTQISSILSAIARESTDSGVHDRAMRLGVLSARASISFPPASGAAASLARAAHYSTLDNVLAGHEFSIYSAAFDQSGKRLVTGSQDKTVRIWRKGPDGSWVSDPASPIEADWMVIDARFAEEGQAIAVRVATGNVAIWRRDNRSWIRSESFEAGRSRVRAFDMDLSGNAAIIGYQDGTLSIWRFTDAGWIFEAALPTDDEIPVAAAFAKDGKRVAVGFHGGTMRMWRRTKIPPWTMELEIPKFQIETQEFDFALEGNRLVAVGVGGDMLILERDNATRWTQVARIANDQHVSSAAFLSLDADFLATNGSLGAARMWAEQVDGRWLEVDQFGRGEGFSRVVAAAPDGQHFVTAGNDAVIRLWGPGEFGSWRSYAKVTRGIGLVRDVKAWTDDHTNFRQSRIVSSDGRRAATNDAYGIVRVRDVESGIEVAAFDVSNLPAYLIELADDDRSMHVRLADPSQLASTRAVSLATARPTQLIDMVCSQKLRGPMSAITEEDIRAAPILESRKGEDVCHFLPLLNRIGHSLRGLFGRT